MIKVKLHFSLEEKTRQLRKQLCMRLNDVKRDESRLRRTADKFQTSKQVKSVLFRIRCRRDGFIVTTTSGRPSLLNRRSMRGLEDTSWCIISVVAHTANHFIAF